MRVSGQRHAPAELLPRGKDPRYPLYRRLGGPQSWSGLRGYRKNPFASAGDRTCLRKGNVRNILVEMFISYRHKAYCLCN
jgi:hypothetical protein